MKIYEVKIKVTKAPVGKVRYVPKTFTILVADAKNPTQSAKTAKELVQKSFEGDSYNFKITKNKTIRHDAIVTVKNDKNDNKKHNI